MIDTQVADNQDINVPSELGLYSLDCYVSFICNNALHSKPLTEFYWKLKHNKMLIDKIIEVWFDLLQTYIAVYSSRYSISQCYTQYSSSECAEAVEVVTQKW